MDIWQLFALNSMETSISFASLLALTISRASMWLLESLYNRFFLSIALILNHKKTIVIAATTSNIMNVIVTPTKAAVSKHSDSAGTEFRLMTTSSLSSFASLNWTSDGDTTLMIFSVSMSA